jgi:serine/threonine protein phosphatase PrpC
MGVSLECYGASRPQQGRSLSEDAFLIAAGEHPVAAVCDGAGNAEQAARRVLREFRRLFAGAAGEEVARFPTWAGWVRMLDLSLGGGTQSTFTAVTVVGQRLLGASVGDSRAYLIDRDGQLQLLSEQAPRPRLGSGRAQAGPIHTRLRHRDTVLLLSDGVWAPLGTYRLQQVVAGAALKRFAELPDAILNAASRTGRADDMTAVVLRLRR